MWYCGVTIEHFMINVNIEIKLILFHELQASKADLEKGADPILQVPGRNDSWQKDFGKFYPVLLCLSQVWLNSFWPQKEFCPIWFTCDVFHEIPFGIKLRCVRCDFNQYDKIPSESKVSQSMFFAFIPRFCRRIMILSL